MQRKKTVYKGLQFIDVWYTDTSLTSPDYFQISEFPTRLTAGKNLFKLLGNPTTLKVGGYLNLEILDYNGDPIYYEVVNYIDEDTSRVIAIYIYEDTPPGDCTITLTAETLNAPPEWQGRANIKWLRTVQVNPTVANDSEIIFETLPAITLSEQIGPHLDRTYATDQFPIYTTGKIKYFLLNNQPAIEISGGSFINDMTAGTITVAAPQNATPLPTYTPSTTAYTSSIKKVLSSTTALLDTAYTVYSSKTIFPHTYTNFANSSFSLTYESTPTYTTTQNSESYALIQISGLQPATGDVSRIKTFMNNNGTVGTWELINDVELVETEIFVTDTASLFPDASIGSFTSQDIIDTYWLRNAFRGRTTLIPPPTLVWSTASIDNAMKISSAFNLDAKNTVLKIRSDVTGIFQENASYKITIDALGTRSGSADPVLAIYMSGSSFYQDPTDYFNQEFSTKFGKRIGELRVTSNNQRFDDYVLNFNSDYTGTGILQLVVESGNWQVANIRTTSDNDAGYTPDYTRIKSLVPTAHKSNNQLSFKIEYYNVAGVKSKQINYSLNNNWQGGNRYVDGDFSMLTGSLYVADSLGSGIEIAGNTGTGYIRTLGYQGFDYGAPGFLMWSGSALPGKTSKGNPYSGVGLELYQDTNNYFRYSTSDSELDIHTSKFFLGGTNQYISGSGGKLEISSSNFYLSASGDVTMAGKITATSGRIGGFEITQNAITGSGFFLSGSATGNGFFISSSKFNVKANGDITGSNVLFTGGKISGFTISDNTLSNANNFYISGAASGNDFFISSSKFNVKASGDVTGSQVLFTGGKIGSFTLTNNALSAGSTFLISSSVDASNLSTAFFISSSKFNVRQDGTVSGSQVLFDGGKIGGFTIDSSKITGTNIVIDSAGSIQTSDYASDLKGWKISAAGNGSAEFENAKIRGTLATTVFEKTSVNAVGGQLYVANSTTLTGSSAAGASTTGNYTPTQTTMSVENVTGFETGEILTAKKFSGTGFATEYLYVNSASRDGVGDTDLTGRLYVTRAYGNGLTGISASLGESPSSAQSYSGSQVIVSTGKLNTGFIRINANPNDTATPYIDIVERTGSGIYDVALKARLGDLSGLANSSYVFGKSNPGFGLATDNVFLQGGIIANTGSIGGINMASSKLFTGTTGTYNNPNTGFYLDATSKFSLKDKLAWDGTTLSIVGQIQVSNGSFVPGSSIYQHGPLTYWPRINGTPPADLLPNASWNAAAENAIEYVMGPYGTQELAITCYPSGGLEDGGFVSDLVPIDSSSAYMFVAYMKRTTDSTQGQAYFGLYGFNSSNGNVGLRSNAATPVTDTNPYFMYGVITPAGESVADSLDRWMLHVGYVYPSGSAYNANATNIVYDLTTGLTASYNGMQPTWTWNTGTTATIIRAYHYYNTSGNAGVLKYQEIARPGIFKMDGTEPTIQSLLSNTSTGGSTKIDGSTITTGKIRSTNWSTTLGSELDLNAGTITLGGSTSPKFNVNASGDVTASSALFSGNVSAVNFSKKMVTVTNDNSGSYFQTVTGGINLIFDGSLPGGEKTMVMEIDCPTNPSLNIKDIIVSNTGSALMPQVEVIISQNNVTFDNANIKTGTAGAIR